MKTPLLLTTKKNFVHRLRRADFSALLLLLGIFFALTFSSCNYGLPFFLYTEEGVEDRSRSLIELTGSNVPQIASGGRYSFVVLTDSHFGAVGQTRAEERFLQKFKELLNDPDEGRRPRFIVNLGDTLDGGHASEAVLFNASSAAWISAAKEALGASDYKVYSILGNHDLYNNGWEIWKQSVYPCVSCYKFTISAGGARSFDFLFLDTGNGTLGGPQIEDLEKNLKASSRPKIVFMHYPVFAGGLFYFTLGDASERARLIDDFAGGNVKYVFEGHTHSSHDYSFGSFTESVVGSYLYYKNFGLVTVDENSSSVNFERFEY